ncbi:MAG: HD domain-containing protein, partial [Methanomassiliicoccales archaeon]
IWRMLKMARALAKEVYPELNYDLVIAGTFLHDLGKITELNSLPVISITREGYLEGHIILGLKLLDQLLKQVSDFPAELRLELEHIILSHHGKPEFGSPKIPVFPEAVAVSLADDVECKIEQYLRAREEASTDNDWFWSKRLGSVYLR